MTDSDNAQEWKSFKRGAWSCGTDVADFIRLNYEPYEGDGAFLEPATERTLKLWGQVLELMKQERRNNGLLSADVSTPSAVDSHKAGYIDRDSEIIVGLQTDAPLRRAIMPFGGYRMVHSSCEAYGLKEDEKVKEIFTKYRKTHNVGVYDAYTPEILAARKSAIITGLPDAYGRGRIIGDYRRLALYGADYLIADKKRQKASSDNSPMTEDVIREREELSEQIAALEAVKRMTLSYGIDVSKPASDFREAVQWTYFAYLAAIKDQNGAAMSLGRVTTFLDIYARRDLESGKITESRAQEIMDDFIIKLRMVRFLRTPEYNDLFSGDPVWVTESVGGMCEDGRTLVTKNSFRLLHTLSNLGPAPEPNITVLWSEKLPRGFKEFCAKTSAESSSIQYENDDLMRPLFGDDYGIACCVSPLVIGKEMQFFGARANLAKALLYAINGGVDERTGVLVAKGFEPIRDEILDFDKVMEKFDKMMDENGVAVDFEIEGDFPKYGNNDDRVDSIAVDLVRRFMGKIRKLPAYRNAIHTQSILTITSNVVYGKKTGNTPDGRMAGVPFAPGANPLHGRDTSGALASLCSVAKLPFEDAKDGISNTFTILPDSLGKSEAEKIGNLCGLIDGYMANKGQHLNVNVLRREVLEDAMDHPEKYPQLTIRVSGYAVNFIKLTRPQQLDVISRTFHAKL